MEINSTSGTAAAVIADWLIVGVGSEETASESLVGIDDSLVKAVQQLRSTDRFTGKIATSRTLDLMKCGNAANVVLVGLGEPEQLTIATLRKSLLGAIRAVKPTAETSICFALDSFEGRGVAAATVAELCVISTLVGCSGADLYREERERSLPVSLTIAGQSGDVTESLLKSAEVIGDAVNLARELVNLCPDELFPESFAARAANAAEECGLNCSVFDEHWLEDQNCGALLAVAKGSERPARVVRLEYRGGSDDDPVLAIVGKGVTFDSGGLSIKPTDSMIAMKSDMAGAATMLAVLTAIAGLKLPVNVVGWAGLVENLISGKSYKLGDVLTARNGKTIEIHNTDAEGRLVLADVLTLAAEEEPAGIIDLATLTGAMVVALGPDYTGSFSNDTDLQDAVAHAAEDTGECIWPMPLPDSYNEMLKSSFADLKNVGPRWGGAISAALFLQNFVRDVPWVHLDIAGPSWVDSGDAVRDAGGTGCLVQTLVRLCQMTSSHNGDE